MRDRRTVNLCLLLGISQRTLHVAEAPTTQPKTSKKAFPKTVKTLGDSIRTKRGERGINQRALARKLNVPRRRIQDWERDRKVPSETEWQKLADELGLPEDLKALSPNS